MLTRDEVETIERIVLRDAVVPRSRRLAATGAHSEDDVALVQRAALEHPNARTRRECLGWLDHHANDASVLVFRAALSDPVPTVRRIALHGLSCRRCRTTELCLPDAVDDLARTLESDPSPTVRHNAVLTLANVGRGDERADHVLEHVARTDLDALVRRVALAAVEGRWRDVRSRKALRRRDRGGRGGRGDRARSRAAT